MEIIYAFFFFGRMLLAIPTAGLIVVAAYLITHLVECKVTQSRILAIPVFAYGFTAAGEFYSAYMYEAFGQKVVFFVPALITFICLFLLIVGHWREKTEIGNSDGKQFNLRDLPFLLNKNIVVSAFLLLTIGLVRTTETVILPVWTVETFDATVGDIGTLWLTPTVAYLFVMILTTYIVSKGYNCFVITGVYIILSGIPTLLLPVCESLTCVALFMISPTPFEMLARYAIVTFVSVSVASQPEFRPYEGTINGIVSFALSGMLILSYLSPLVYFKFGVYIVFWLYGGLVLLAGLVSLFSYQLFEKTNAIYQRLP